MYRHVEHNHSIDEDNNVTKILKKLKIFKFFKLEMHETINENEACDKANEILSNMFATFTI
jgi:hypothetical protein